MDYHVLTQDDRRKSINVIFHIPVPATGTNEAGVTWRDAIVKEQGGADEISSALPDISTEELSAMKSGALIEVQRTVYFSTPNITNAQRVAEVGQFFSNLTSELVAEKTVKLAFMGYSGDVA